MNRLLALVLCLASWACAALEPTPPFSELADCTESVAEHHGWDVPEVPSGVRADAIGAATKWATSTGYLPCHYKMCGTITGYNEKEVSVYVSYEPLPNPPPGSRRIDEIEFSIGPEAGIVFSLPELTVREAAMWHQPCGK